MELVLRREIIVNKSLCRITGALIFIIMTALGAFVRIPLPFTPVPITLQTFFVLLSGLFLGSSLGASSQIGYIFLGVAGLPIFTAAGSGLLYLAGPTTGYLIGFILAAFFTGTFIKNARNSFFGAFCVICAADFILLFSGVIWLKLIFGYSFGKLLLIGMAPFIPGDLIKALAAAFIYLKLKNRIKEVF